MRLFIDSLDEPVSRLKLHQGLITLDTTSNCLRDQDRELQAGVAHLSEPAVDAVSFRASRVRGQLAI